MNKNIFLIVLLLSMLINLTSKSQSLKIGLRYEPGILLTEQNSSTEIVPVLFCLSANFIVQPNTWLNFLVRPGILFVDEQYSGFEIGAFVRLMLFSTKFYLITGINNHSNREYAHNRSGSYGKEMLFKSIGLGYQADSKFGVDICYYWTSDKEYAYALLTDGLTYSRIVNRQMNGILKLGLNLSWDIL